MHNPHYPSEVDRSPGSNTGVIEVCPADRRVFDRGPHPHGQLIVDASEMATRRRQVQGIVVHSDNPLRATPDRNVTRPPGG